MALQSYNSATSAIRAGLDSSAFPEKWAVIMDIDETVLDNSDYDKWRVDEDRKWRSSEWEAWVRAERARPVPGAHAFIRYVRDQGGAIAMVSNRSESSRDSTWRNLEACDCTPDLLLLMDESPDKSGRWKEVAMAFAPVMWIGDQVSDFPAVESRPSEDGEHEPVIAIAPELTPMSQKTEFGRCSGLIGRSFIVLPNPVYGDWTKNSWR